MRLQHSLLNPSLNFIWLNFHLTHLHIAQARHARGFPHVRYTYTGKHRIGGCSRGIAHAGTHGMLLSLLLRVEEKPNSIITKSFTLRTTQVRIFTALPPHAHRSRIQRTKGIHLRAHTYFTDRIVQVSHLLGNAALQRSYSHRSCSIIPFMRFYMLIQIIAPGEMFATGRTHIRSLERMCPQVPLQMLHPLEQLVTGYQRTCMGTVFIIDVVLQTGGRMRGNNGKYIETESGIVSREWSGWLRGWLLLSGKRLCHHDVDIGKRLPSDTIGLLLE